MSSGVYLLEFAPGVTYVGKSVNIEGRYDQHIKSLRDGTASVKMQHAYNAYGPPNVQVLASCHADHIALVETLMVKLLKPSLNVAFTAKVSRADLDTIETYPEYLNMSTGSLIARIMELEHKLKTSGSSHKAVEILGLKLIEEKNKSWWEKLFG